MKYLVVLVLLTCNIYAKQKAVYDPIDNRLNLEDVKNPILYNLAKSTLAKVDSNSLAQVDDNLFSLEGFPLGENRHMCKDERFIDEPMSASCTGFLVAKDTIVTAGHCIHSDDSCGNESWILDYTRKNYNIKKENIYKCSKIIARHLDFENKLDYAIIKLDRQVKNRPFFKLRKKGVPDMSIELAVIGYPSGLPLKIADGGTFRKTFSKNFYTTTLDSFHGNSGSPVLNAKTGLVEGILTQGEDDYEIDYINNCRRVKVCKIDDCRGEDVTKITLLPLNLIK